MRLVVYYYILINYDLPTTQSNLRKIQHADNMTHSDLINALNKNADSYKNLFYQKIGI